jgi:Holliday junction resolvase RusA-like endonuclease
VTLFELFVPGVPQPAGSKKAVPVFNRHTGQYVRAASGRPIVNVVDDAKRSRPWKSHISAMVANAWRGAPLDEPLSLSIVFTMPRPASHYGRRRGVRYLKPSAPRFHTSKPDATKLLRCAEDALLGVLLKDDSRVAESHVRKVYGEVPGAAIRVSSAVAEAVAIPIQQEIP